ncbi:MAG: recombinase family protein [Polyangiaceae bacterium]|nr:recombinase family protein [Polyangiaceae bacterium]
MRWLPNGSKQEFGPDGKLLRVIEPGVNIKKAKSDIIRFVPSTPDRVAVVKRMFDLCVQGYGFHHIAQAFNDEAIPSPAGLKWNTARIAKLIRNPVYRGAIAWNRHTMGTLFGLDGDGKLKPKRKKMWQRNDEADWIISDDVHEPLVSKETWTAAQRAVAKRRAEHGNARPTKRTLLAGLMVCKRCGHPFTTIRDCRWPGPTGEGYRSYACSGYHRYGKSVCRVVNVPGPALDRFVLDAVRRTLLGDHATVEKAVAAFVKAVLAPRTKAKPTGKKLRAKDRPLANDFVSDAEFERLLAAWFGNMARVLEPGRGFYIWGGYANVANYPPVLKTCELYFSQAIIWVKEHPVLTRKDGRGSRVERVRFAWERGKVSEL